MLIRSAVLDDIFAGRIDTLFRRQKRPTVKAGGTLRTQRGMLDIVEVTAIHTADVTDDDARRAGFASAAEVVAALEEKPDGTDYRVRVRPGGTDPRHELSQESDLSPAQLAEVTAKLERLDRRAPGDPWTMSVLRLIADNPHVRAADLAASTGRDMAPFKADVRKLKTLGLTISHSPGYELSPRGRAVLAHLERPE